MGTHEIGTGAAVVLVRRTRTPAGHGASRNDITGTVGQGELGAVVEEADALCGVDDASLEVAGGERRADARGQ